MKGKRIGIKKGMLEIVQDPIKKSGEKSGGRLVVVGQTERGVRYANKGEKDAGELSIKALHVGGGVSTWHKQTKQKVMPRGRASD